jgi:hypothetical protein
MVGNELEKRLSLTQYQLLCYLEQSYWQSGEVLSYEAIRANGIVLDKAEYIAAWENSKFVGELQRRGLPERLTRPLATGGAVGGGAVGGFEHVLLTEQQIQVANVMLDMLDKRSRLKKLTELGVSTATYNSWMRDPLYRKYCLDRAEELLASAQPIAHSSLIDRVSSGDLGAVKYFNSMTGRYRERGVAPIEVTMQQTNNYGTDMMLGIVEIIQRHVKDPETLSAIGDEILALNRGETTPPMIILDGDTAPPPVLKGPKYVPALTDTGFNL